MTLRPALLLVALAVPALAWGQAPAPPTRVVHLSYVEGPVKFQAAETSATSALPDRPLEPGDRLTTERGARAELVFGTATIRLDEVSELTIADLAELTTRVDLAAGSASVYLRELLEGETFAIVTPSATLMLDEPGEYRVDVQADAASVLTVRAGAAEVATASGPVRVAAGQRVRLDGRDAYARLETARQPDAFDDWVLEREVQLAEAEPPRYTPYEEGRYEELDRHGDWYDEPRYGRVWMPNYYYGYSSPYRHGYWQRSGFGWSWYDPAPWGFFTFHSGRWAYLNHLNRWCWVPGPRSQTHPFGRPRSNPRDRVPREDGPRLAERRLNDGDVRRPVVPASSAKPRNDASRPTPQREPASGERERGGTIARGGNRERNPSPPTAAPPQQGGGTMRPTRADPPARSETTSAKPQSKPAFGTQRIP